MENTAQAPEVQENQPEKVKKGPKKIVLIIIGIVAVLLLAFVLTLAFSPKPTVTSLRLSDSVIDYNDGILITVSYENPSAFSSSKKIPIYVNDEVAIENTIKLKSHETRTETYNLDNLTDGDYTVTVSDQSDSFTVRTPASFSVDMTVTPGCFIVGESNEIDFTVTNVGESYGDGAIDLSVNGNVIETRNYPLVGSESAEDSFIFDSVDGDTMTIDIGDASFNAKVYTATPLVNKTKLMENTVKGYGYFEFTNYTDKDVIVYFTDYNNTAVAVSAIVVGMWETVKISSFPHGSYAMFVQTGEYWVDELGGFAKDQKIARSNTEFKFNNNVSKVYGGTYTYWTINYWNIDDTEYYTMVDNPPALVK